MSDRGVERKLAAIFAADVAGYSRLMEADEVGTVAALKSRRAVVDALVAAHRGRIFNTAGDSVMADFASAVDALHCAVAAQRAVAEQNAAAAEGAAMQFRIGLHVGDVIVDGGDLLGDGVNIAARLQALALPGGICVSAAVRDHVGGNVAVAFADLGERPVKNIAQPVRAYRVAGLGAADAQLPAAALPLPDKPSIAVLPFANLSGDPEQDYFADGMVEEIITALSRIRWLFVIARKSSATYKGQAVDVKQVGRELGVRYVLEGSVRKAGQRVRISAELIEATTGTHLWADRFDGSLDDVFELQDKVAVSIAGVIEPTLQDAEMRHSAERWTRDPTAYDLYLRALAGMTAYTRESILDALDLIDQALAREPDYAPALALAASYRLDLDNFGGDHDPAAHRQAAIDLARRALRAGADDPRVLGRAAIVLGRFGDDIDVALALSERALALNPSFADGWYHAGWLRLFAGQLASAIDHFERSLRLNPRDQRGFHLCGIGTAQLLDRRFDAAVATLRLSLAELPAFAPTYRALAASYAQLGRQEEARAVIERLRGLSAVIMPQGQAFRDPAQAEIFAAGLRRAAG